MFKNLKQKVASDQRVRTPQSKPTNEASSATSSERKVASTGRSRITRPAHPVGFPIDTSNESNNVSLEKSLTELKESGDNLPKYDAKNSEEMSHRRYDKSPGDVGQNNGVQSEAVLSDRKVPFFKRLEFLTPLKDQVAKGLSESKESISSLVDEMRSNLSNPQSDGSKHDGAAQQKQRSLVDVTSDVEDLTSQQQSIVDLNAISKDQLHAKVLRLEKSLLKYRERESQHSSIVRQAKQEREKLQSVMQQTQDKNLRRIQELKEQAELDLKAKMHLEEEFRVSLEEKDQLIQVQQTQIAILKGDPAKPVEDTKSSQTILNEESEKKLRQLEEQLKFAKETCQGLQSQRDAVQAQLDERLEEIDSVKMSNATEKSKLIKQLREAKNVIEQIEEDKQTAVAEAKRQMHEVMEAKDGELKALQDRLSMMTAEINDVKTKNEATSRELQSAMSVVKTAETERDDMSEKICLLNKNLEDRLNKMEADFDVERKQFTSTISHLKAGELKLNEVIQKLNEKHESDLQAQEKSHRMALEDQSQSFKAEMLEKENQMRLAIEERELNKMAAVSQQDAETQSLLKELNGQLEIGNQQVEALQKERTEEAEQFRNTINKLKEELDNKKSEYESELKNLIDNHDQHMSSKAEEFLERYTSQKNKYEDRMASNESMWIKKMEEAQSSFSEDKQALESQMEALKEEKAAAAKTVATKMSSMEGDLDGLMQQRDSLHSELLEMKVELDQRNEEIKNVANEHQKKESELLSMQTELKTTIIAKDAEISMLNMQHESLSKEVQAKQQDVLQKSENSKSELQELHQNIIALQTEKSQLENKLAENKEKVKDQERLAKEHILEMEEKHSKALSAQADELEVQKQNFVTQIANLEKNNLDAHNASEQTQQKFLEAAGRLKALAQKYKATVAEHEAAMKNSSSDLAQEQEKCKLLNERIWQLDQDRSSIEADNQQKINDMKCDFENEKARLEKELNVTFMEEKSLMEDAHRKEMEDLSAAAASKMDEEKISMIKDMTERFEAHKGQLLAEAEKKLIIEKEKMELMLSTETSDASEKLREALQQKENMLKSFEASKEEIAALQVKLEEKENHLTKIMQAHSSLNAQLVNVTQDLEKRESEIKQLSETIEANLNCANDEKSRIEDARALLQKKLSTKETELAKAMSVLDDRTSEMKKLQSEFEQRCSMSDEVSLEVSKLQSRINELETLLQEQSSQMRNTSEMHKTSIDKLSQDWEGKYSELKSKAEHKILQLQQHLKLAKEELTSQCDVVEKLGQQKSDYENEIGELSQRINGLEQQNQELVDFQDKFKSLKQKYQSLEKSLDDYKNHSISSEQSKIDEISRLKFDLESKETLYNDLQSSVDDLRVKLSESKSKCEQLTVTIQEQDKQLEQTSETAHKQDEDMAKLQEDMQNTQHLLEERNCEIGHLKQKLNVSETQLVNHSQEYELLKKTEQDQRSSLQLSLAQNEQMSQSLKNLRDEYTNKESSFKKELQSMKDSCQQNIKDAISRLESESEKKVTDFKKKAEIRLAQIKKTFSVQLEDKLKAISSLEEEKAALTMQLEEAISNVQKNVADSDSKLQSVLEEKDKAISVLEENKRDLKDQIFELDKNKEAALSEKDLLIEKMREDIKQMKKDIVDLNTEKRTMQESLTSEKEEYEIKLRQESEQRIQNLLEEEQLRYQEGQQQLSEVKDHLEQVLQEAKLKLEEAEKKIDDEKDRADIALQEEKDKRMQSEVKFSVLQEDFSVAMKEHDLKLEELMSQNHALKNNLQLMEEEVRKVKQNMSEKESSLTSQLEAARKRNVKLEKDRELVKSKMQEEADEYERRITALNDEVSSTQKQVEVLSKTAVEDNEVEVERKLDSLKDDFNKRLKDKDDEISQKLKRLIVEYETQIHQNEQAADEKVEKLTQKHLSLQDSMRSDHHKELMFLQRELQAKEKQMEDVEQKYETEMHEMEKTMSDQVDKAMYRAMVAEKKLQQSDYEKENQTLQTQLTELSKNLAETQQRERQSASIVQSLEARLAVSTPLADPDKLEYLRRILYSYIMGSEQRTMAKVLTLVLQYNELDSQQILEKHGVSNK